MRHEGGFLAAVVKRGFVVFCWEGFEHNEALLLNDQVKPGDQKRIENESRLFFAK